MSTETFKIQDTVKLDKVDEKHKLYVMLFGPFFEQKIAELQKFLQKVGKVIGIGDFGVGEENVQVVTIQIEDEGKQYFLNLPASDVVAA